MKRRTSALAAAGLALAMAGLGTTAQAATVDRYPLTGPSANVFCYNLEPFPGELVGESVDGFALFRASRGTLTGSFQLRNAEPNTDYVVRLIQAASGDCHTIDIILHTNAQGTGVVRWSEPIVGTRAQVIIDTGSIYGNPTYRATEFFTIPQS